MDDGVPAVCSSRGAGRGGQGQIWYIYSNAARTRVAHLGRPCRPTPRAARQIPSAWTPLRWYLGLVIKDGCWRWSRDTERGSGPDGNRHAGAWRAIAGWSSPTCRRLLSDTEGLYAGALERP